MSGAWTDQLAGARMQVDQQFNDQVRESEFSNQQWGLIMTAVTFEIEDPGDPEQATLVANTEQVPQILPELDNIPQGMGGAPGGRDSSSDGLFSRIRGLFSGDSDGVDDDQLEAALRLVEAYTDQLQTFLEDQGRWEELCETAAAEQ